MNFKRKIYAQMLEWKNKKERKALVIEGLRQVGKSYIVNKFALENYENIYSFDFRQYESHRMAFAKSFSLKDFKDTLFIIFGKEYNDNNAVLIFDEIGDCPDARAAIKYILKETKFDIIATGSLLGVKGFKNRQQRSPSVGSNHYLTMYPMDFEEFMWANDITPSIISKISDAIESWTPIDVFFHQKFSELFKHYIICGGMPEAVIQYIETHDFAKVIATNDNKLKDLQGDFGRIIDKDGKVIIDENLLLRTNEVFSSIVGQLAKDNSKFQYSFVRKGGRAKEYEEAITWLDNSGMIAKCYNLNDVALPLDGYAEHDCFKMYFSDIGLYITKMGNEAAALILGSDLDSYGGYIYEGVAADALHKSGIGLYYSNNNKSELDFVVQDNGEPSILEVKMTKGNAKSAKAVIEGKANRHASKCYKVTSKNFSKGSYYYGLPHYALLFLLDYLKNKTLTNLQVEPVSIK